MMNRNDYPYLHYRRTSSVPYQIIKNNIYIAGRKDKESIMPIYYKCERVDWDLPSLMEIKENYRQCKHKRHMKLNGEKYIYPLEKHGETYGYHITIKGCYIGFTKTIDDAKMVRDIYLETGEIPLHLCKRKPRGGNAPGRYIYKTESGHFRIRHDGTDYGTFHSLRDALEERDLLAKCNWDYSELEAYPAGGGD